LVYFLWRCGIKYYHIHFLQVLVILLCVVRRCGVEYYHAHCRFHSLTWFLFVFFVVASFFVPCGLCPSSVLTRCQMGHGECQMGVQFCSKKNTGKVGDDSFVISHRPPP
jgi:hypothetical protein